MDTDSQLTQFVGCLWEPQDIIEIRCLPSKRQKWVTAARLHELTPWLRKANDGGDNIYIGANPRKNVGGAENEDAALARCLFNDFDQPDAITLARQKIDAAELPPPTLLVDSGHGVHPYWRLAEPMTDLAQWRAEQKRMIALLGSDKGIHDPARIMRLPGFLNIKRDPFVPCCIVESHPERRYTIGQLRPAGNSNGLTPIKRARKYAAAVPPQTVGGRDLAAFTIACFCVRDLALSDADTLPILMEWNQRNTPPLEMEGNNSIGEALRNARKYGKHPVGCGLYEKATGPDPVALPEDRRNSLLRIVNTAMVGQYGGAYVVARVEKLGGHGGEFHLIDAEGRRLVLGKIKCIRSNRCVAEQIQDQTGDVSIRANRKDWQRVANAITRLAEQREGVPLVQRVEEWLRDYLSRGCYRFCFSEEPNAPRGSLPWKQTKYRDFGREKTGALLLADDALALHLEAFLAYVRDHYRNEAEGIKSAQIENVLTELGFDSPTKRTSRLRVKLDQTGGLPGSVTPLPTMRISVEKRCWVWRGWEKGLNWDESGTSGTPDETHDVPTADAP